MVQRIYTDSRCLEHLAPTGYPEQPERLATVLEHLRDQRYDIVEAGSHAGRNPAVEAVHDLAYVERFRNAVDRGDGLLDSADNPLSPGTWIAATAAVDATLAACDWIAAGADRQAFVLIRPPGHHAERHLAMGFCFFNNIAVAAQYLNSRCGLERIAIYDFDVHHGNGTQHLFEERPDVFFLSTHQYPFYPGTGSRSERGSGEGAGRTLNLPLPAGTGDQEWLAAIEAEIVPAIIDFSPQALLLSAGFDAWCRDPVGGLDITLEGFGRLGEILGEASRELGPVPVLGLLEGGYDLEALGKLVREFLSGLDDAS